MSPVYEPIPINVTCARSWTGLISLPRHEVRIILTQSLSFSFLPLRAAGRVIPLIYKDTTLGFLAFFHDHTDVKDTGFFGAQNEPNGDGEWLTKNIFMANIGEMEL